MDQKWQTIKKELQCCLPRGQYDLWVSTIDFLGVEDDTLRLGCRNRLHADWLREKLEENLLRLAAPHFPQVHRLEYQIVCER